MTMFHTSAYLKGYSSRSDGSLSIRFVTQEVKGSDVEKLNKFLNGFGSLLFKESTFEAGDVPKEDPVETGKSLSARLRGALFVQWKNGIEVDDEEPFEHFYARKMEKAITSIKNKLPNEN